MRKAKELGRNRSLSILPGRSEGATSIAGRNLKRCQGQRAPPEHAVEAVRYRPRTAARKLNGKALDGQERPPNVRQEANTQRPQAGRTRSGPTHSWLRSASHPTYGGFMLSFLNCFGLPCWRPRETSDLLFGLFERWSPALAPPTPNGKKFPFGMCSRVCAAPRAELAIHPTATLEASGEAARIRELLHRSPRSKPEVFHFAVCGRRSRPAPCPAWIPWKRSSSKMFRRDDPSAVLVQAIFVMLHLDAQVSPHQA